jgi:hypothetical protein
MAGRYYRTRLGRGVLARTTSWLGAQADWQTAQRQDRRILGSVRPAVGSPHMSTSPLAPIGQFRIGIDCGLHPNRLDPFRSNGQRDVYRLANGISGREARSPPSAESIDMAQITGRPQQNDAEDGAKNTSNRTIYIPTASEGYLLIDTRQKNTAIAVAIHKARMTTPKVGLRSVTRSSHLENLVSTTTP